MIKTIIQNESSLPCSEVLKYVAVSMESGRISANNSYCSVTSFFDGPVVYALKNKKSDRFIVRDCSE